MEEKLIKNLNQEKDSIFRQPQGEMFCVYFSSASNNTQRFVEKIGIPNSRIPIELEENIKVDRDYVLISPTYSGGGNLTAGAVPKQVIKFLNNPENRSYCRGVIGSGNTNFGNTYGLAGKVLAQKLKVPLLYTFEISGTIDDVNKVKEIIKNF